MSRTTRHGGAPQPPASLERRGLFRGGVAGIAALSVARQAAAAPATEGKPPGYEGFLFLNQREAESVEDISERIWPETPTGPGARIAGAVYYIDRALDGPYARHQGTYRRGLRQLDGAARTLHRKPFYELDAQPQHDMLAQLERNALPGFAGSRGRDFFELLRTHTMEGVFCDPIYGGNRYFAGWRVVGYPGAHYLFTAEQQQSTQPLNLPPQSVADL